MKILQKWEFYKNVLTCRSGVAKKKQKTKTNKKTFIRKMQNGLKYWEKKYLSLFDVRIAKLKKEKKKKKKNSSFAIMLVEKKGGL